MNDAERANEFLKEAGMYYLATADGAQPHVRIFTSHSVLDGKLYIQTGNKKDVFKQLLANPKAEICAFSKGKWMRITGELVHDDRVEARKAVLDAQPELRTVYHYDENDGVCAVLYFKSANVVIASFTDAPETFTL